MTPRVEAAVWAARFEIGCDSAAASRLCAGLAAELYRRYGVCEALQGLELALSELLSNIVRHGRGATRIVLSARQHAGHVRLVLLDDGAAFNMAARPARLPDDLLATSGRGLWLVRQMTSSLRGYRGCGRNIRGLRSQPIAPPQRPAQVPT